MQLSTCLQKMSTTSTTSNKLNETEVQCKLCQVKLAYHESTTTTLQSLEIKACGRRKGSIHWPTPDQVNLMTDAQKQTIAFNLKMIAKTCSIVPLRKKHHSKLRKPYDEEANKMHMPAAEVQSLTTTTDLLLLKQLENTESCSADQSFTTINLANVFSTALAFYVCILVYIAYICSSEGEEF